MDKWILGNVYFALLLDNLLLTAVVPILPHFVHHETDQTAIVVVQHPGNQSTSSSGLYNLLKTSAEHFHIGRGYQPDVGDNSRLGFLLSLKAIVQLVANPLVAILSQKRGLPLPLILGTVNLIICTLLFAFGKSYTILSIARALQGVTSACFTIAGLGLVASTYNNDETKRSQALGRALGGGAVGVLLGYPIGGFLYQLIGKTAPFLLITSLSLLLLATFVVTLSGIERPNSPAEELEVVGDLNQLPIAGYRNDHRNYVLGVVIGAIFLSTSVMSLLEPCLPLWLLKTMKPERWQLGAVFIPDSCGYLITTHFLGGLAYRIGRWKVAMISIITIGICCTLVPLANSIIYLTGPHFGIGAGIGAVDASLVPLLATLADYNQNTDDRKSPNSSYGRTFALGQTAVSLAYCLGPMVGGFLVESVGFPRLMFGMGVLNLLFSPLILVLKPANKQDPTEKTSLKLFSSKRNDYERFDNEETLEYEEHE